MCRLNKENGMKKLKSLITAKCNMRIYYVTRIKNGICFCILANIVTDLIMSVSLHC